MRLFGTIATILLIASSFALATPATADNVDECKSIVSADVCVYDTTAGDADQACDESGSGSYEGRTGADASTGDRQPFAKASAGGEEECGHAWSYDETQQIYADAVVCIEGSKVLCTTGADASIAWDQDGIQAMWLRGVEVATPVAGMSAGAQWTESWNGETLDVDIVVCLEATGDCVPSATTEAGWEDGSIGSDATVCLQSGGFFCGGGAGAGAYWAESWSGKCLIGGYVYGMGTLDEYAEESCPAGPPPAPPAAPGSPNPGWGDVTPDTGE